jgi:L-ascorbate metabolism protein UlaG (beta-lactamase superfamily)
VFVDDAVICQEAFMESLANQNSGVSRVFRARHAMVAAIVLAISTAPAFAQSTGLVTITPLGSHANELCRNDRALLFEDATGVRILYDPGRTVDEGDPRLGTVHVMLLSHAHTDHIGDARPNRSAPGTCATPAAGAANPDTNFVSIAASKGAAVFAAGELNSYLGRKIQALRGSATPGCPESGLESVTTVPTPSVCVASLRPGGSRSVTRSGAGAAVRIAAVQALHSNGINPNFIETPGVAPGLTGYGGGEAGFVIRFTNGLVVYLTGDSGMFGDMETIIARYYKPNLVVLNMSDTVTLGPDEASFTIKHLVRPTSVMPTHVNEQATSGGAIRSGTRVERFAALVQPFAEVVVPISDVPRQFDGEGRCVRCQ